MRVDPPSILSLLVLGIDLSYFSTWGGSDTLVGTMYSCFDVKCSGKAARSY